jgi:hypothetical protein
MSEEESENLYLVVILISFFFRDFLIIASDHLCFLRGIGLTR